MSRSFKKHPCATDGRAGRKIQKRWANRTVRGKEEIPNGGAYKKVFCSWNIHDYTLRWTWKEAKEEYEHGLNNTYLQERYPTLKEFYRFWRKYYYNK